MKTLLLTIIIVLCSSSILSPQTIQKWAVSYNGAGNFADYANAIGVDNSGNIYVTGRSYGSGTNYDYSTIKYSSSGVQQWVKTYNGAGNGEDVAVSLAIDGSGNVYVTGYSWNTVNLWDFVTIKYDPSGTEMWVRVYDGASHHIDIAHFVAVDNSGDIYVTGESFSFGTSYDFVTLKYSSAGALQWTRSYNGPGNAADVGHCVCVDNAGSILVTGHSTGVGTLYDYALVKYNSAGVQQWAARYDGPANGNDYGRSLISDGAGNVYVTGYSAGSGTNNDFATVKYNSGGTQQWVQRYNGAANSDDRGNSIALDMAGNVYVGGGSVGSTTSSDFALIKYSPSGGQLWVQSYNGPGNAFDFIRSLAVDDSNYIYVTGESFGSGTGYEYATIKYTNSGIMKWLMRYNGLASGYDLSTAIALDGQYNVFVTGYSAGTGTNYDYTTVKYYQCRLVVSAGNDTTIFYGYGNQTAVLTATPGGEPPPYTYNWSSGGNTQTITVSPTQTTSYYVTVQDAQGCMNTDTVTVFVNDVRCGPQNRKVYVCHNDHTICVDSHAVSAHLMHGDVLGSCGDEYLDPEKPVTYRLYTNYPNPFNPVTSLSFDLPKAGNVKLIIYDVIGREVALIVNKYLEEGTHRYEWNGMNFPSGVYFYRLETNDFSDVKKMVLIK